MVIVIFAYIFETSHQNLLEIFLKTHLSWLSSRLSDLFILLLLLLFFISIQMALFDAHIFVELALVEVGYFVQKRGSTHHTLPDRALFLLHLPLTDIYQGGTQARSQGGTQARSQRGTQARSQRGTQARSQRGPGFTND